MRISHPTTEGVMHASRWLFHRVLLDVEEMRHLLSSLPPFTIYNVSELLPWGELSISLDRFLDHYAAYLAPLREGKRPSEEQCIPYFSSVFSASPEAVYAMEGAKGKYMVRIKTPVVQLALHRFVFTKETHHFHSMVHAKGGVSWGLQFSYPQLYATSLQQEPMAVYKDQTLPNTQLFRTLAQWVRTQTVPPRFGYEGKELRPAFRVGKLLRREIHLHPQLQEVGLSV